MNLALAGRAHASGLRNSISGLTERIGGFHTFGQHPSLAATEAELQRASAIEYIERPVQPSRLKAISALFAGLALSACATGPQSAGTPGAASASATAGAPASSGSGQRDLTAGEKKIIMDAVAPNLKDPASAKYHWAKFPAMTMQDSVNYCAIVDAKSPYPAYDGRQNYIVATKVQGGRVIAATMGLIAGGKDASLVTKMCAKYDLDPNKAS